MSRKLFMGSLRWLRVVPVLVILILCSACTRASDTEHPRDITSNVPRIKRETARSSALAKTGRVPAKRLAHNGDASTKPVRRSEEPEGTGSNEAVVEAPINNPPPNNSIPELARAV